MQRRTLHRSLPLLILWIVVGTGAALGLMEAGTRLLAGGPTGRFLGWFPGDGGLYPESAVLHMPGPIPYVAHTNRLGFRGAEWSVEKPRGTVRIAALGDSVTDGFFVDDESTYPSLLQEALSVPGRTVEVFDAAHGGGSIDKEFAILRDRVAPFTPDVVVLTFVTNDLFDISGRTREELVTATVRRPGPGDRLLRFVITRTAAGEWLWERFLRFRSPTYVKSLEMAGRSPSARYRIEGGDRFAENADLFLKRFPRRDALVLQDPLPPEVLDLADRYVFALAKLHSFCRERGMDLIFVYFPAYPQVYRERPSRAIQELLRTACAADGIPFLDLTDAFRREGAAKVLHLAPVDFHPNPDGNRVLARTVAAFLEPRLASASSGVEAGQDPVGDHESLPGTGAIRRIGGDPESP